MEVELSHVFATPIDELWAVVLDPERVAKCIPGIQSVDVISETEYLAKIKVKIAFISANFTIRAVITDKNAPTSLTAEATGQDSSIGSSVKAIVGMNLTSLDAGQTELRVKATATVLGRLGTLGLNPMRTKAERMWEQFCEALEALLAGAEVVGGTIVAPAAVPAQAETGAVAPGTAQSASPQAIAHVPHVTPRKRGLFSFFRPNAADESFRIEFDRGGTKVAITCPASHADQCLAWLDRQLGPQAGQ